jgi:hypothetical protein
MWKAGKSSMYDDLFLLPLHIISNLWLRSQLSKFNKFRNPAVVLRVVNGQLILFRDSTLIYLGGNWVECFTETMLFLWD